MINHFFFQSVTALDEGNEGRFLQGALRAGGARGRPLSACPAGAALLPELLSFQNCSAFRAALLPELLCFPSERERARYLRCSCIASRKAAPEYPRAPEASGGRGPALSAAGAFGPPY